MVTQLSNRYALGVPLKYHFHEIVWMELARVELAGLMSVCSNKTL